MSSPASRPAGSAQSEDASAKLLARSSLPRVQLFSRSKPRPPASRLPSGNLTSRRVALSSAPLLRVFAVSEGCALRNRPSTGVPPTTPSMVLSPASRSNVLQGKTSRRIGPATGGGCNRQFRRPCDHESLAPCQGAAGGVRVSRMRLRHPDPFGSNAVKAIKPRTNSLQCTDRPLAGG